MSDTAIKIPVRSKKLDDDELRALVDELRRRHSLMKELSRLSMKILAVKYGLHLDSVRRIDWKVHSFHRSDPVMPAYMSGAATQEQS
ncbi:MAG TPA: hypothetical protein VGG49_02460 [Steroidobacteraceae bacterium]|jgi:hypothetical protein